MVGVDSVNPGFAIVEMARATLLRSTGFGGVRVLANTWGLLARATGLEPATFGVTSLV